MSRARAAFGLSDPRVQQVADFHTVWNAVRDRSELIDRVVDAFVEHTGCSRSKVAAALIDYLDEFVSDEDI